MHWQPLFYIASALIAAAVSAALAGLAGHRRAVRGAKPFALLMLAVAEWLVGNALEMGSVSLSAKVFWANVQYVGIVLVPVAWLAFALQYAGRQTWLTRRNCLLLLVLPAVTLGVIWTNPAHGLFRSAVRLDRSGAFPVLDSTRGPWFGVHTVYSYLLLLLGTALLIQRLMDSSHLYRRQVGALLMGVLAPWVGNVIFIAGFNPLGNGDPIPFTFTVGGLAIAWGLFRFRLFDLVPVARDALVEDMCDALIVLDEQDRIVDLNPAAQQLRGRAPPDPIGRPVGQVFPDLPASLRAALDASQEPVEVALGKDPPRSFDLRGSPLYDRRGRLTGRLVVLRDITQRVAAEKALRQARDELERRVEARTAELARVNRQLRADITERKQAEEQVQHLANKLKAIARPARQMSALLDPDQLVQQVVRSLQEITGCYNANFFLLEADELVLAAGRGGYTNGAPPLGYRLGVGRGIIGQVAQTGQPVLVSDVRENAHYVAWEALPHTRSELAVPVRSGDRLLGVMDMQATGPEAFDATDLEALGVLADQLAVALENARLYEDVQRGLRRVQALREIDRAITASFDLHLTLNVCLEQGAAQLGTDAAAVLLLNPQAQVLEYAAGRGFRAAAFQHTHLRLGEGLAGRTALERRLVHIPNLAEAKSGLKRSTLLADERFITYYGVPLIVKGQIKGVLEAFHREALDPDPEWLDFLKTLAGQVAIAIDNAKLFDDLQRSNLELIRAYDTTLGGNSRIIHEPPAGGCSHLIKCKVGKKDFLLNILSYLCSRVQLSLRHGSTPAEDSLPSAPSPQGRRIWTMTLTYSIRTVKDLRPGDHLCCLYETDAEHRALLIPYLRQGLAQGEKVLYILDVRTAEAILDYLRDAGLKIDPYLAKGQLNILTADETYMPGDSFDPDEMIALLQTETERALAAGYSALRVTGEMSWVLRGSPGSERLIEYEAKLNDFFPGRQCLALCQYDRRRFDPALLLDVLRTHPVAAIGTELYDNFYYIPPTKFLGRNVSVATLHHWIDNLATRKQVEEQLQESNRRLENRERYITRILESIPSSLVVIDRALRIVSANRNFLEKARRDAPATVGRKIEDALPQVLLEYTRLDRKVREVFRTGQPVEGGRFAYRAPGLPTRIYYYRLIPLKAEGAVENVMLLMDDITEREQLEEDVRQAERHLASVVECANDLVISMDPQGRIVTWNRAAEKVSGLAAEQVEGRSLAALCAPEHRPMMAEMLQGLARGEGVQNTEVNLQTLNGRQAVPIAWSCSSMQDDTGTVVGIVAVGRDLTERRQLEAQLIQSAKMASLGEMAGGIAHELRNPLGIISASAQLLAECSDNDQLRHMCTQKIYDATQRASLIIESLLKFARPRGEQMKAVDVPGVLEETLALLAHQMALQNGDPSSCRTSQTRRPCQWLRFS